MKTIHAALISGMLVTIGVLLGGGCDRRSGNGLADWDPSGPDPTKDPAWKPTHEEIAVWTICSPARPGLVHSFCVNAEGNLLVCCGAKSARPDVPASAPEPTAIKVVSPDGRVVATWPLDFLPQAICRAGGGEVIVGGDGRLARLDATGRVLHTGSAPGASRSSLTDDELKALLRQRNIPLDKLEEYRTRIQSHRLIITGLAATEQDVFVAGSSPRGFGYAVYRVDHQFQNPVLLVDNLSGCCGQMDVAAHEGKLWVAHNGRHRVECFDREGRKLREFGRRDRRAADGFGGCCEPKNLRLAANGDVFASESGPPVVIKHFNAEGKFQGVVALPKFTTGCVRLTVDFGLDGKRFYLLDTGKSAIRVFAPRGEGDSTTMARSAL